MNFPALFDSPDVDQQTFLSEDGCIWRYHNATSNIKEEQVASEILAFLFAVSPEGVVIKTLGRKAAHP